jgi:hypothetical protein
MGAQERDPRRVRLLAAFSNHVMCFLIASVSYVAYAENFTLSMTHGFTIKAPGVNTPQYFDLSGTSGQIVYTDDNDRQIPFDPCVAPAKPPRVFVILRCGCIYAQSFMLPPHSSLSATYNSLSLCAQLHRVR